MTFQKINERNPWEWQIDDLQELIGSSERMDLEFKSSRMLNDKKIKDFKDEISKDISAMLNSIGGVIVIGIETGKLPEDKEIAKNLDAGVEYKKVSRGRLLDIINSSIDPRFSDLRLHSINADSSEKYGYFVLSIPSGNSCYQATDNKFYKREEFNNQAMSTQDIKFRLFRTEKPDAIIECKIDPARDREYKITKKVPRAMLLELPGDEPRSIPHEIKVRNEWGIELWIKNIGEINIHQFDYHWVLQKNQSKIIAEGRDSQRDGDFDTRDVSIANLGASIGKTTGFVPPISVNIYPKQRIRIWNKLIEKDTDKRGKIETFTLKYQIFLENRDPINQEIPINV